jgi:hypothetical protein
MAVDQASQPREEAGPTTCSLKLLNPRSSAARRPDMPNPADCCSTERCPRRPSDTDDHREDAPQLSTPQSSGKRTPARRLAHPPQHARRLHPRLDARPRLGLHRRRARPDQRSVLAASSAHRGSLAAPDPHYFDLCNAVAAKGVSPMIRVPSDEIWLLKRALDAGAHAIMVPQINTAVSPESLCVLHLSPCVGRCEASGPGLQIWTSESQVSASAFSLCLSILGAEASGPW